MRPSAVVAFTVLAAACTSSRTKLCGDFVCSEADVCTPDGNRCTSPLAITACQGKSDHDACSFPGVAAGVCASQVCELAGCGNGIVEPASDEVCDDGNRISGDGCSADCKSTESCGDGVLNPGEFCDCGDPSLTSTPTPGCTELNSQAPNAGCRTNCLPRRCGDGVVDAPAETCDDANALPGDGCALDCSGRWTKMASNTFQHLAAVWATSATDAWAVGTNRVLHWDGTVWARLPEIDQLTHDYTAVCGISATTIFTLAGGHVFRYDGALPGGAWSDVTPPDGGYYWSAIYCRPGAAWIAAQYALGSTKGIGFGAWNGSAFTANYFVNSAGQVTSLWTSPAGQVFVVDSSGELFAQQAPGATTWDLQVAPPGGKLLVGTSTSDMTLTTANGASHFASGWTPIPGSDELPYAQGIVIVPGATPTRMLLVGNSGAILECTATACTPSLTPTEQVLKGVSAVDDKHAFVVGLSGTILY